METLIKAVFFDIGGTLVKKNNNSKRDLDTIKQMMRFLDEPGTPQAFIHKVSAREVEYKQWRSKSLLELKPSERWPQFLLSEYPADFIREHANRLQQWWANSKGIKWMESETVETLQELARRGYMLGTISHTSPRYLEEAGISDLFTTMIHASEFGRRKPHPSLFLAAARECGLRPEDCAYVGDRPSRDVVGSREAGFGEVVIIESDDREPEVETVPMKPDHKISKLPELLELFPDRSHSVIPSVTPKEAYFLYDAALSTMWGIKENIPLADFFKKGRSLGFARFELNHQLPPDRFAELDQTQYHIGSVHDPCPAFIFAKQLERSDVQITSLDEKLRIEGVDVVKGTIEQAFRLGANSVIIHPGRIAGDHSMDVKIRELFRAGHKDTGEYEELRQCLIADRSERGKPHLEALLKSIDELIAFASSTGLSLGLENRLYYYELPVMEEMQQILDTFEEPWVGWQLDVGHLQIHSNLGITNFNEWLRRFSKRIIGVHLHDVRGLSDHQAPGSGEVDFKKIAKYLPEFAYRTLEVHPNIPVEEIRSGMEALVAAGCIVRI
jgi:putative hydrolase of the HAD superfamily